MNPNIKSRWLLFVWILTPSVNLQMPMPYPMPMPMPMPAPVFAFPPPPPVPVAVPVPVPVVVGEIRRHTTTTTTTTTTTERPPEEYDDKPVQIPLPVQISIYPGSGPHRRPGFMSMPFPPSMPAPAFGIPIPVPVPPPIVGPPPVVMMPIRHRKPFRSRSLRSRSSSSSRDTYDTSYSSDTSSSGSSSYWSGYRGRGYKKTKYGHAKRRPYYRRALESSEISENELVKPVLTYVSKDGDIKLKKRLSNNDAVELLDSRRYSKFRVSTDEDSNKKGRVLVVSKDEEEPKSNHRRKQVVLRSGSSQHVLGDGRKELVFRPPENKQISNLSVSFQISDR